MKIECDKCSAKYSIADEKVRGKTFKIRCKKCSNVIIVRDKVAAAAAGGGGAEAAPDQAHPGWHLAINGETVGPMSEDDVRARYDAGEIDKDTAIWQEGFEDWVPLGDVEGFADLPDRVAPTGDDPFASANQDDYAAAGGVAAAAAMQQPVAAVGGDPYGQPEEPQSPRVSSLTGQRNENSVLFSLDSLQALATGGGAAAQAPAAGGGGGAAGPGNTRTGTKGLATVAPGSEGSGLIDIRALGAMVGSDAQAPAAAATAGAAVDDAALPSFGGSGLGGLAAAPLVPQPEPAGAAAAAAAAQPPARSNAPLYFMMAILILAVVGLGVYIVLKPPAEPVVVTQDNPDAPSVKAVGADEEEDKDEDDDDEDEDKDDDGEEKDDGDEEDEGGDDGEEEGAEDGDDAGTLADGGKGKGKKGKGKGKGGGKGGSSKSPLDGFPSGSSDPAPKPKDSPKSSKGSDLDVDCILDPKACGKGKSSSKKPAQTGATDPSLPEKLSTTDIRAGVAPVKGAAKSCGSRHGAKKGEKVKVKLSISGKTGSVTKASAQSPHAGTPLGNCVASALKKAKFKKFRKASLGAVYPVTM